MLGVIACISQDGIIGVNGFLPFNLPEDMKLFKSVTENQMVVMGRNTFESIRRPLPNRHNVVISSTLKSNTVEVLPSIQSVLEKYEDRYKSDDQWIWFIGGANIYKEALSIPVNLISLSITNKKVQLEASDVPVYFPEIDSSVYDVSSRYKLSNVVDVYLFDRIDSSESSKQI
jgi:dihydrofolate reductase